MFRCSECQKEYDIKPDYCEECGNDIFEEISTAQEEAKQTPPETPAAAENPKPIIEEKQVETIKQDIKIQREEPRRQMSPEDIASFGIFGLCLLLSFIIVFFINPAPKEEAVVQKKEEIKIADIPSLDSFWNNKPPEVQVEQKAQQPVIKMPEVQPVQEVPAPPEPKTTKVELKYFPKNNVNNQAKVQPKAQPKIQNTIQPKTQPKAQPVTQTKVQPKTQSNTQVQKPTSTQQQTKTTTVQNKQPVQQQVQQKPVSQPVQTATQTTTQPQQVQKTVQTQTTQSQDVLLAQKKEFSAYKVNLRNTIGRKIDFADVIGDGSCTVSFKIDSTGKLINRAFSKQSSNLTLNDAVYKAVMQTPSYNPPPSGYKGETLSLKISFYNGNFEINLN